MQFSGVNSIYLKDGKKLYKINSSSYIKKLSANSFADFIFGKENFFLKNNCYIDGILEDKNLSISFKKAFKSGEEFYLYDIKGVVLNKKIKAKKAIYSKKRVILYKCEIKDSKSILRRKKYIINLTQDIK